MIYEDLLNLIGFADNLIVYIEKQLTDKKHPFLDIVFLMHIEHIFDTKGRGLYSDQEGFNLDEEQRVNVKKQITESMDKIRRVIPDLIDSYGRDQFVEELRTTQRLQSENWVKR